MENRETIQHKVIGFITETFPLASIRGVDPSANLLDQGIVDSFGLLEVLSFIEETFGFTVEDQDITETNFASVASIAAYVDRTLAGRSSGVNTV